MRLDGDRWEIWVMRADGSGQTPLIEWDVGVGAPMWIEPPPRSVGPAGDWSDLRRRLGARGYTTCSPASATGLLREYVCAGAGRATAQVVVGKASAIERSVADLDLGGGCLLYADGQRWLVVLHYAKGQASRAIWDAHTLGTQVAACHAM